MQHKPGHVGDELARRGVGYTLRGRWNANGNDSETHVCFFKRYMNEFEHHTIDYLEVSVILNYRNNSITTWSNAITKSDRSVRDNSNSIRHNRIWIIPR